MMNYKFYQFFSRNLCYMQDLIKIQFSGKCIKSNAISKFMFVDSDNKIGYFCIACSI